MIFGAIASAVVGGLFAKSAAKKERANSLEDARLQLSRLRESAETAGFNPLTALQNGGASIGSNIPSGVAPLASTSVVQNVVKGVSDHFTGKAAQDKAKEDMEQELMKIDLEKARAGGAYPAVNSRWNSSRSPGVATLGIKPVPADDISIGSQPIPSAGETMVTNPHTRNGVKTYVDANSPDAEHASQRYGDIAEEFAGLRNGVRDYFHNNLIQGFAVKYGDEGGQMLNKVIADNPGISKELAISMVKNKFPNITNRKAAWAKKYPPFSQGWSEPRPW